MSYNHENCQVDAEKYFKKLTGLVTGVGWVVYLRDTTMQRPGWVVREPN